MDLIKLSEAAASVVRDLLASRRMTVRQLAEATGIPYVTLYRRLNAATTSPMTTRELYVIANVLGTSGSTILQIAEDAEGVRA